MYLLQCSIYIVYQSTVLYCTVTLVVHVQWNMLATVHCAVTYCTIVSSTVLYCLYNNNNKYNYIVYGDLVLIVCVAPELI